MEPLTRDQFRNAVFERDNRKCVVCGNPAVDAHHILERRLWRDGGYHLDNGVSVCSDHHIQCEMTIISVEEIREYAGITNVIVPDHLYADQVYDKWGNPILSNGKRLKGELFEDESVQKILQAGDVLRDFIDYVKYPRTFHLPWSKSRTGDDRTLSTIAYFKGKDVVITEKMDGENTSMYSSGIHARSVEGLSHPSQTWVKGYWAQRCGHIPQGWRICGENLYAKHAIYYQDLPTYFMGFSIWNEHNVCLSWDETCEWFELLDIEPVPVLYSGKFPGIPWFDDHEKNTDWNDHEGYVVRLRDEFSYDQFGTSVAKYVRASHVQTTVHNWRTQPVIPNLLRDNARLVADL